MKAIRVKVRFSLFPLLKSSWEISHETKPFHMIFSNKRISQFSSLELHPWLPVQTNLNRFHALESQGFMRISFSENSIWKPNWKGNPEDDCKAHTAEKETPLKTMPVSQSSEHLTHTTNRTRTQVDSHPNTSCRL